MSASVLADGVSLALGQYVLLEPVSFCVPAGGALAVIGANGSGKTTLLRLAAGLEPPTTGSVKVGGEPADERNRTFRARVAALIGSPPLARNLTLHEHLTLVTTTWGWELSAAKSHSEELLYQLQLSRLIDRFPHELSTGQSQLFGLALLLARPRDVLLLDEPEHRLDADHLRIVATILSGVLEQGTTLLFASHSEWLVAHLATDSMSLDGPRCQR